MTTSTSEKEDGIEALNAAIEKIRATITSVDGGQFSVKTEVRKKCLILMSMISQLS